MNKLKLNCGLVENKNDMKAYDKITQYLLRDK